MVTQERKDLIAKFQKIIDLNVAKNIVASSYANIAENYAEMKLTERKCIKCNKKST